MLPLALITGFLFVLLLLVGLYRSTSKFAVEKRIEQIREAEAQTAQEELEKPFVQRVLLPMGESVAKLFRGYTPAEVAERTDKKLVMAGLFPRVTGMQLQGLCWFSAAACVMVVITVMVKIGRAHV